MESFDARRPTSAGSRIVCRLIQESRCRANVQRTEMCRTGAARSVMRPSSRRLSPWSMADTLARLSAVVAARGMEVFAVIDHSGKARDVGLDLRDTKLVIFGSPSAVTRVIEAAPLAALDLPLRVVVWEDGYRTLVSYPAPARSHAGMASMETWQTHLPASMRSSVRSSTASPDGRDHRLHGLVRRVVDKSPPLQTAHSFEPRRKRRPP